MKFFKPLTKKKIVLLFCFLLSTAFFILVSIADFARKTHVDFASDEEQLDYDFSYAFALCTIAMLSSLGAGAAMIADTVKTG